MDRVWIGWPHQPGKRRWHSRVASANRLTTRLPASQGGAAGPGSVERGEAQARGGPVVEGGRAVGDEPGVGRRRDHRPVVGAQPRARQERGPPGRRRRLGHPLPQPGVGRHPATQHQRAGAHGVGGAEQLVHEGVDDGLLERRAHVGHGAVRVAASLEHHRGLETRERGVETLVEHRPGERDRPRVALAGEAIDDRPTGVPEVERTGDLVVRLAGRVVDGATEDAVPAVLSAADLMAAQRLVRRLPVGDNVVEAILTLVRAGRPEESPVEGLADLVAWGPGPRASQALMLAVRARALLQGRLAPSMEDVLALAAPVLRHRMALTFAARADGITVTDVIGRLTKPLE